GRLPGPRPAVGEHGRPCGQLRLRRAGAPRGFRRVGRGDARARPAFPGGTGARLDTPFGGRAHRGRNALPLLRVALQRGPRGSSRRRVARARRGRGPAARTGAARALDPRRGDLLALHGRSLAGAVRPPRDLEMSVEASTTPLGTAGSLAGAW